MELIWKPDKVIKDWRRKLADKGVKFARIQTTRVMHDRAAVVEENERNITVEFPSRKEIKGKSVWNIRREVLPRRELVDGRWYED